MFRKLNRLAGGRVGRAILILATGWGLWPGSLAAQRPSVEQAEQPEGSVRLTPEMARGLAGFYTQHVLKGRYELPEEKLEEAREMVARRIMQTAHKIDEPGRELVERFVEEQLSWQADNRGQGGGFMPPTFGKEFADRLLPILPEIRELTRGVTQDVRPMLPFKQQLKMAGDMMAFKAGVDGFEVTMQKWASGEVTEYKDPFRGGEERKKDEQGQTQRLKSAREVARNEMDRPRAKNWANYVEKFKELYGLDAAQVATAESVLREYTDREEQMRADEAWLNRIYDCQLWTTMEWELENAWNHPAKWLIEDGSAVVRKPLNDLEEEFKQRLESIPTSAQRRAAEQRVTALLKEKGLLLPETQP